MALDDDVLDYYSIVPPEAAPEPRLFSVLNVIEDALHYLIRYKRPSPIKTEPTRTDYPNDLTIQFPHIPSSYELQDQTRPFTYFFDLLEAAIDRMQFEAGQERTYRLQLDSGSFGSFITSLVHIDQERHPPSDSPHPSERDIKEGLAEYAAERLGLREYKVLSVDMRYSSPHPTVTIKLLKENNAVPALS